jgi:hypothetical protein
MSSKKEFKDCLDWYRWAIKNNLQALKNDNGNFLKIVIAKYSPFNKSEIGELIKLKQEFRKYCKDFFYK